MAEIKWFEKNLSIKNSPELTAAIAAYLPAADPTPKTGKDLLTNLLTRVKTAISYSEYEQLKLAHDELEKKLLENHEKTTGLQQENERLLAENQRLQQENERLTDPQTVENQFFEWLKVIAKDFVRPEDTGPEAVFGRISFQLTDLSNSVTEYKLANETLTEQLTEARSKEFKLAANQAVLTFTNEQLTNIRLLRQLSLQLGHHFRTQEPGEVIHHVMQSHLETLRGMVQQLKQIEPILNLIE